MGYDPATGTLTPNTPIADLRAHSAGNGLPTTVVCGPNPYYRYPTRLEGVVDLKASGFVNGGPSRRRLTWSATRVECKHV